MKNIIVREYLESLTERDELDYLFPVLLEVMGYKIISTPKATKGLQQYGKDVIAVGADTDGVKKRFYFEIKGGADRNITTSNYSKDDGIRESILEAKDRPYQDSSIPGFNELPVKIVIVHNGVLHPSIKETFDGFIEREFKTGSTSNPDNFEFARWDIYELTELFTTHLFNEYLLTDEQSVLHFKKVLVLINTPRNNYVDYFRLIDSIFDKAGNYDDLPERKRLLFFETLNLVSFIISTYSREAGNLEAAKKCLPYSILRLWHWVLNNEKESDPKVLEHFNKHLAIFMRMLDEYFRRTLPVAKLENGLWSSQGGRYEQIGYPLRAMEFLSYLLFYFESQETIHQSNPVPFIEGLIQVLNANDATTRPLLDNHSIPICLTVAYFVRHGRENDAKSFLRNVFHSVRLGWETFRRLPDGNNRIESVIRFIVTRKKSVFYVDQTSHLIAILFELLVLLDMESEYTEYRPFFAALKLDLGVFIPYTDELLREYQPDNKFTHELNLFSKELSEEGYQAEIQLDDEYTQFREKTLAKNEFSYEYRTVKAGMSFLLTLAHIYFKTPFFPDYWRNDNKK